MHPAEDGTETGHKDNDLRAVCYHSLRVATTQEMIPTLTAGFYICRLSVSDLFLLSNCSFGTHVNSTCLSSFSRTVQSRSLQNIQASRVLHAPEPPYSTDDETETLHRHLAADGDLDDIAARMEKLGVTQERSGLDSVSQNYSQEERMDHFHIDPITGHVAALTWDPQRSARLRPHADDM